MIEVVIKITEKIAEFKKKAEEAAEAMKKAGEVGPDAILKIDESILGLNAQLAALNGDYLTELLDKLKLINAQSMDELVSEFEKVKQAADDALDKANVNFFDNVLSLGKDSGLVRGVKQDLDGTIDRVRELRRIGASSADVGDLLAAAMGRVNLQLEHSKGLHESVKQALQFERDRIEDMQREYAKLNERTEKQKELAKGQFDKDETNRIQEAIHAREELTNKVRELMAATHALLDEDRSAEELKIQKIEEEIAKWRELDAQRQAQFPGIKEMYGEEIKALEQKRDLLREEQAQRQSMMQRGIIPGLSAPLPDISAGLDRKPIFGGTSAALELAKIKQNGPEAQAALTKVLDSVESVNQKFNEQVAILEELHAKYPTVFNDKMLKQAKEQIDPMRQAWKQLGADMGQTIAQAALFGRSWSDALKSMLAQLLQVIIQMTILNKLKKDGESEGGGGGGGFGGIFSSLIGGLFGGKRASGGPVGASHAYMVGENGPELFVPPSDGTIVPNHALKSAKPTVNYSFVQNVTTPDADSFKKSHGQLAAEAYGRMQSAHTRNR